MTDEQDVLAVSGPPPKKRLRTERACVRCREKRAKCDGATPACTNCAKSQRADACVYPPPTKRASRKQIADLQDQLARLQHLHGAGGGGGTDPADIPTTQEGALHLLSLASASPLSGAQSENGGVAQFLDAATPAERMLGLSTKEAAFDTDVSAEADDASLAAGPSASQDMFVLPPYQQAVELVSWFSEHTHAVFPVLLWDEFMASFEATYPTQGQAIASRDRLWLTTLNLVLAFSAQIQLVGGATQLSADPQLAGKLFQRSQQLVSTSEIMAMGNIKAVQVLLLIAQYAMSSSQAHLTANTVALAISISRRLRLDKPESYALLSVRDAELRRRLWSGCVAVSGLSSAMLSLPTPITEADIKEALLPNPLPMEDASDAPAPRILFLRETVKLFGIKVQVLRRIYEANDDPLSTVSLTAVLELDAKLDEWANARPACFKRPSVERESMWLELQRNVLIARWLYIRLLLHRPALFALCHRGGMATDDEGRLTLTMELAKICAGRAAQAAGSLLSHIALYYQRQLAGAWWHNLSHLYASALALLASLAASRRHPQLDPENQVFPHNARELLSRAVGILDNISRPQSSGAASPAQKTAAACAKRLERLIAALDAPPTRPVSPRPGPSAPPHHQQPTPSVFEPLDDDFLNALLSHDHSGPRMVETGLSIYGNDFSTTNGLAPWASMDLSLSSHSPMGGSQTFLW